MSTADDDTPKVRVDALRAGFSGKEVLRGIRLAVAPKPLKVAASSAGIASAPDPHARTEERSRCSAPASNSIRYIAGTPMKIDARRCSIASRRFRTKRSSHASWVAVCAPTST